MVPALLTNEPRSAYCCSRASIMPFMPVHSRHFCRSATDDEPGQAKIESIWPVASAGPHFFASDASVLVSSLASASLAFRSVGGTNAPPANEPTQIGVRLPAAPAFVCAARHFCVALRAPWKNLTPCLL